MLRRKPDPRFPLSIAEPGTSDLGAGSSLPKTVWISLGSLLIAALSLFAQKVSVWILIAALSYITIVGVAVIAGPIRQFLKWINARSLRRLLIRQHYPRLRNFINVLAPQLEESRSETVLEVLNSTQGWPEAKSHVRFDHEHIRTLKSWVSSISDRLALDKKDEFYWLASDIGNVMVHYNHFCQDAQRQLESLVSTIGIPEQKSRSVKQSWNQFRDRHNHILRTWEDIAKNINAKAGAQVCFDHYAHLKTIE